ncbi:L,D-transpeptidase family protein [uncultured Sphingosinicella sp.]|uniref:L,D-transpeptidase family protein n=1 Tax=uncultured Sphingosinicella sp. TaxID=478748 RepID=UPI0030D7F01E
MSAIRVDTAARTLTAFGETIQCLIGKAGATDAAAKREGDAMTPRGTYPIRALLVRPDKLAVPNTKLPWRWLHESDGWSDDVRDPAYNRPVRHPHPFSAEHLWREDGLYDLIIILGHNDTPPVEGMGSAIFLHCMAAKDFTQGCVAIPREALLAVLARLAPGDMIEIV